MSTGLDLSHAHVLVTGGAGFIGSHLVDALVAHGAQVRVLDDLSSGRRENLERHLGRIEFVQGDLRHLAVCEKALDGITHVSHQAAIASVSRSLESPAVTLAVNAQGTANLFQAARNAPVKRVVFASSASVYGCDASTPNREGNEGTERSPYAVSKSLAEQIAQMYAACFDMVAIGLRYFNVYGPRQDPAGAYASVIPRFLAARVSGTTPIIYGSGEQSRDFVFVSDVVEANLLALTTDVPKFACYNVGTGRATTVTAVAEAVDSIVAVGAPYLHAEARPQEVFTSVADTTLSAQALGFRAAVTLLDGLEETFGHLVRRSASSRPA